MNNEFLSVAILVDIDCLFDTRLSTLFQMNSVDITKLIKSNKYHTRQTDSFESIDYKTFQEAYSKRNKKTLLTAATTEIKTYISEYVKNTMQNNIGEPNPVLPVIILNTYPYNLNKDEEKLITKALIKVTNSMAEIEIVNFDISQVTPEYIKKKISAYITYNALEWLEYYSENKLLAKYNCPSVELISPRIHHKEIDDEIKKILIENDPFQFAMDSAKFFIDLKFIPISFFSISKKFIKDLRN